MLYLIKKSRSGKILLSILIFFSLIFLLGCYSSAPSQGWTGPIVQDGTLYVGTIESRIIALEPSSGEKLTWEYVMEGQGSSGFGCGSYLSKAMSTYGVPAVKDGVIYVGGYDGIVYSIDADPSDANPRVSKFETDGAIVGSPVIDGESLFVGSTDGKLYAFDLQLNLKWDFQTEDRIWSTPAVDNGIVYIGSTDNRVYALDAVSGEEIWRFEASAGILSTPLVFEGVVYIGACDNKFYAIDAENGEEKWNFEAENWFWTQALYYNGEIWVGNCDHNIYALNAVSGDKTYEFQTDGRVCSPPVFVTDQIIIGSEDGNLYTIDPQEKKGAPLCSLGAPILAPIYVDTENGTIYVHAQDGTHTLYAINAKTGDEKWHLNTSSTE